MKNDKEFEPQTGDTIGCIMGDGKLYKGLVRYQYKSLSKNGRKYYQVRNEKGQIVDWWADIEQVPTRMVLTEKEL